MTYKVLNGSAPRYLGPHVPVADLPGRRTLRSAGTNRLLVPPVRLSTVGNLSRLPIPFKIDHAGQAAYEMFGIKRRFQRR